MIALSPGGRVYLACGVTDMRKGAVGLAMLVQQRVWPRTRPTDRCMPSVAVDPD